MLVATNSEKIAASSLVHITLLDEFIRTAQEKMKGQHDSFIRDSLSDLLSNLRDERAGYAEILGSIALNRTA